MRGSALVGAALALSASVGAQEAAPDWSICSNDLSDPHIHDYDAVPPAACHTVGCSAGEYFNEYWDDDGSGCLDGDGRECCMPCDPGMFQTVDSTADPTSRATTCTVCETPFDPSTGAWHSPPQYVSSGCGAAATRTVQTGLTECSTPAATQFVSAPCSAGSPDAVGTDTELTDCTQPNATQVTVVPCFSGSTDECTANFPSTPSLPAAHHASACLVPSANR